MSEQKAMTPEQKIKHMVILKAISWDYLPHDTQVTADNVDALYDELAEDDLHVDAESEIRFSGIETDIPAPSSRHYESESVAAQAPDGSWVGWTYWYGGGKHGEPESIDWMSDAYDLNVTEEQKLVTVRTFTKVNG